MEAAITANGAATPADDDAPNRRPRDVRLIHALLATQGVTSYQERVPLMLIDFAYRYTRSVLADAASLDAEGYGPETRGRGNKEEGVSMTSLRLAIASRQAAQIQSRVGRADLTEMSAETNRVGLPRVEREFGVRLPDERFVLTGTGFGLPEEWIEDEETNENLNVQAGEPQDQLMLDQDDEEGGVDLADEDMEEDEFEEVMGVQKDKTMTDA